MKQAIITDYPECRPIVKGNVVFDCPAFIIIDVTANSKKYPGADLIEGRQKFSKEWYDAKILNDEPPIPT